jgi:hypothetical protein
MSKSHMRKGSSPATCTAPSAAPHSLSLTFKFSYTKFFNSRNKISDCKCFDYSNTRSFKDI